MILTQVWQDIDVSLTVYMQQYSGGSGQQCITRQKKWKLQVLEKGNKISLFSFLTSDPVAYIENPRDSREKLLGG